MAGTDFTSDTDADLLGYMAMREEDSEAARDAFAEFYRRHAQWLLTTVRRHRLVSLVGGNDGARDVVQDTFLKAYGAAATFNDGGLSDGKALSRRARAWLGGIANRVVYDACRPTEDGDALSATLEGLSAVRCSDEAEAPSDRALAARKALDALDEREKDVILEMLLHHKYGEKHQRLPNDVSRSLAEKWKTTPENIRAIRSRTLKKLREQLATVPEELRGR